VKHLSEQDKEDDEQREQGNRLGKGESQESITDQLLCNVGVAGSAIDQGSEHDTEASAHSGKGDGGAASTDHLGGSQDAHGTALDQLSGNRGGLVCRKGADRLSPDSTDQARGGQTEDDRGLDGRHGGQRGLRHLLRNGRAGDLGGLGLRGETAQGAQPGKEALCLTEGHFDVFRNLGKWKIIRGARSLGPRT